MEVLYPQCAGRDVHSRCVNACVRIAAGRKATSEHREFATTTAGLLELSAWLTEAGCTHVAMEATGVYWKRVRLFCVGGPEGSRRGCERHGKSYLTRRRRGEEGDGGGSLTGGAIPSA